MSRIAFLLIAFATVSSARMLKNAPTATFINDCGLMTSVQVFNDKCESMRKDMRARENVVDLWDSAAPQFFEFEDKVFDASGIDVSATDACGKKLYPMTDFVYLCKVDYAAEDDEANVDPPAPSPSPATSPVTIENKCSEPVMVGNAFFAHDQTYDARCAAYATLQPGESMYLNVSPDQTETTYFSAYGTDTQANIPAFSETDAGIGVNGDYLARMVDPSKEHAGCDNQLMGNDLYHAYTESSALIVLC
ncbi:hypothetical protein PBCVNEJV1_574L [Paramecium bursaria Chlorella virus NE-JV-1]|nr:hypothetical protein PBCVNEJV1_574L [Paramecium bursaria Chlorella virus NE-JV-1]